MSSIPCSRSRTIDQMSPAFPPSLLSASNLDRSTYFRDLWVVHPLLSEAQSRVRRLIQLGLRDRIIVLNGPTGVGKTRLCRLLLAECLAGNRQRMADEPEYIPAFLVELAADRDGRFDWRDHFQRTLTQLNEPLVDSKVLPNYDSGSLEWGTERVLRQAYEHCL